ncbi:hypothetical protein Patl1_32392 [Pistacia atlantica]|uniref:Uncharacterized protein n=1 Tax=Pistacia atlantica TaxID=434234 RepID=A0ACC1AQB6_9ROSI|nr:hypothetical protein Patl1_32392 [Pistacia atlantica]
MDNKDHHSSSSTLKNPHPLCNLATESSQIHVQTAALKRKAGRKKFQETRHPVYKGVRRRNGKWVCELREPNKKTRIWLGTFSRPEMAARAHDAAVLALRGESAFLNFPETARALPRAKSDNIQDIQYAAMEAAGAFGNEKSYCSSSSSSSCVMENSEVYVDEEEVFNMPGIIDGMAEALILTPPALKKGFKWDDVEDTVDLTLWSD